MFLIVSFFVFGPRGVGKSTWIRAHFKNDSALYFNLLDPEVFESVLMASQRLKEILSLKENQNKIVIIDEIQKVPALLDIIHDELSKKKRVFVLTGSSARKLKQKGVNLLAGRASVYYLFPLSFAELKEQFDLSKCLERGLLPESYFSNFDEEYKEYLKSYVFTYIEKEIQKNSYFTRSSVSPNTERSMSFFQRSTGYKNFH